jgi:peptidyl-tRNA hydrolase, PTH1 family
MPSDDRWIVVGLANPGDRYAGTRHNIGGEVVSCLAGRLGTQMSANKRVRCAIGEARDGDARLVLARPLEYMNKSGGPVQQAAAWYKTPVEQIIVVHDDLDLDVGVIRLKQGGGPGGHNGLRDIDQRLGTREYLRVRVGIGRPPGRMDPRDHVLSRFKRDERTEMDVTVEEAADAALMIVHDGLEPAQNRYHSR